MILSQKNIEEIAVAVIRDFQKSFFGSEADDPARFALPTPIDQFASDYTKIQNCVWDVRRFILLTNLVID